MYVEDENWNKMLREMDIEDLIEYFDIRGEFESKEEKEEFRFLTFQLEKKHFKLSSELSRYIVDTRLGYGYKHISGILTFEENTKEWELKGGIPRKKFRLLCRILNLENDLPKIEIKNFISFDDLNKYSKKG